MVKSRRTQRRHAPITTRIFFSSIGFLIAGSVAFVLLSGCDASQAPTRSHGEGEFDHVRFVDTLRARGYNVKIGDPVSQPFLSVQGIQLKLTGKGIPATELQSFNYDSVRTAQADARKLESGDSYQTMKIQWRAPPHFYAKDRVIVLYVGDNANVEALLADLLGPSIAER